MLFRKENLSIIVVLNWRLFPYHNIEEMKYLKLGKAYGESGMMEPDKEDLDRIVSKFEEKGLDIIDRG